MGKEYEHLNQSKRAMLYRLRKEGKSKSEIAQMLDCDRSTVYRELNRNRCEVNKCYLPDTAEKLSSSRRDQSGSKIGRSKKLQQEIEDYLTMGWSPEAIAGRLELESGKQIISHESIYKWIYGEGRHLVLHQHLIRKKRKRGRRPCRKVDSTKIPNRISIHKRPQSHKDCFGVWEGDTIHFAGHKGSILTLYEKRSKLTLGGKMNGLTSEEIIGAVEMIFKSFPEKARISLTLDNGKEFTNHEQLQKKLGLKTYFCDTYCSHQKGGVEHANGILRRSIPKGSRAEDYSSEDIQKYLHQMNSMPRKSLGYKIPYESFLQNLTNQHKIINLMTNGVALQN